MDLAFAIAQGIGLAVACGVRPFLPALLAGAVATANLFWIDFDHTDYAFLEQPAFLLAVLVGVVLVVLVERRRRTAAFEPGPLGAAVAGIGIGIGALLFAGSLADAGEIAWPGLLGGLACAAVGQIAARGIFTGAAARLDSSARAALPAYADGTSLLLAAAAILLPPLSIVTLGFAVWIIVRRRRRSGEKFAGLRVLR
ncbi:MAG: DUF4126 family protein [Actinomycetota bacterium]|nr:DUF4126 family protein [Actinomycetota bacterium]